jgi:hypothetical protein
MTSGNPNPGSPNFSQKSSSTKNKTHGNSQEQRNSHSGNSGNGGDEDPSKRVIEKSHTTLIRPKRKREIVQKAGQEVPECELKDMEVDVVIGEPNWVEQRLIENREIAEELACQEPVVFEEEFVTLHHVTFNKSSKKLLIEKVNLKNKKVVEKWNSEIDIQGVKPSKVMEFHEATREALKYSIDEIEKENLILKERVKELENACTAKTFIC